ncbi:winged helix-turn-helix domain-containing protein [Ruegeria pomeroyi]|uniref:Transcriptional regulator, ArsR family n=2 Tax=Ruegeria pomeroyi TaxID=89184 RepID=Q5LLW2_RUEPO|nr:winged helix-turn-helix domain-containing protein [Ruegeria pomeroyi]AAV97023.1 transcriptional regulator, ArsR family [Ruegeria pomeroyi DSS-3]NVK99500.1 winged helix-turn-helix transcriptional regulator [Ruegeria pomeroyi]NVL03228.1 winged helix-turn-helix transcriptional regulator [Ruegeria pomeroyi]QWV10548.1 winged helix-turn-helix domain-containing protein [Ruegeria pomeroyi]
MTLTPRLDILGAALADSSRARMLCELMDGRAYTNKELASAAGVTPQTATAHLRRLEEAGLIRATRSGRCLYHSIAGPDVAEALETLSALAPSDHLYRVQQRKGARLKMLEARSCYDHLAGRLGVAIAQALLELGDLARDGAQYRVVPSERWAKLGVTLTGRAPLARPCLDWTERLPHVAGPVGREVLSHALSANWLRRVRGERGLEVTPAGAVALRQILGIRWEGGQCYQN